MAEAVYLLCGTTALACAMLLYRGYLRTPSRLLLWSALCFSLLTVNNVVLFFDLVIYPESDLSIIRNCIALSGAGVLLFGLIWEAT